MRKQKWGRWLLEKKWIIFVVSIVVALAVALPIGLITSKTIAAYVSGILVIIIPNVVVLYKLAEGVWQIMRVGWRQMDMSLKLQDEQIKSLQYLEELQRNNIDSFLRIYIKSVDYQGLKEVSNQYIVIKVIVSNFLVHSCRIKAFSLQSKTKELSYINCGGNTFRLKPQTPLKLVGKIDACQLSPQDITLEIDRKIADSIKKSGDEQKSITYVLSTEWTIEIEDIAETKEYFHKELLTYIDFPPKFTKEIF